MFLNQPSPMKIRVKSRIADLFLLRKIDYANLAVEFPDIIKKAYSKSVHNFDKILSLIAKQKHNINKCNQQIANIYEKITTMLNTMMMKTM